MKQNFRSGLYSTLLATLLGLWSCLNHWATTGAGDGDGDGDVGSICPNTKEEEKEQQEEDQRAKPQRAKPQSPPNPPTRIHCTNGNYAYLTEAVLWGQGGIVRTTKNGIDMEIKLMRELGERMLPYLVVTLSARDLGDHACIS